jgi:signal transduction histidine kinase
VSIRFKVILPYLVLTLFIAVTGAYVVTRLVSNSLSERLTNQLLEAGRVVSDTMVRQELKQVDDVRLVAYTSGVGEALRDGDAEGLSDLAVRAAGGANIESVLLFDGQGREMFHAIKQADGSIEDASKPGQATTFPFVLTLLEENNPDSFPKRALATDTIDGRYYYLTAIPVVLNGQVVGVAAVGTSLNTLLPLLENTASADVVIYDSTGQAIASSLGSNATDPLFLRTISISKDRYDEIVVQDEIVTGENFEVDMRQYILAQAPLKIGDDRLAVFAVILPADYVVESGSASRNDYIFIYSLAMFGTILIGYFVARLIINPLLSLVRTTRAIASGDLTQRTRIKSNDEIGVLANTFNDMTENLQQRTVELEKTNKVLEQMDRTKMRFIQVSAHELRTPLTLVQGYAQMVNIKAKDRADLTKYTNGILDGTTRIVEIIDNMLDVSRIDTNQLEAMSIPMEIEPVIEKVQKTFKSAFEERKIHFTAEGFSSLPEIQGDKELLYKVFYHVIGNAIKYTPDGGNIEANGRIFQNGANEPHVEITIKDSGIGIDKESQELVFEKFYQTGDVLLHSSGKTKFKGGGPGLGLAIARGIVNAHHGRIWLESPGHDEVTNPGTKVFVQLPVNGHAHDSA